MAKVNADQLRLAEEQNIMNMIDKAIEGKDFFDAKFVIASAHKVIFDENTKSLKEQTCINNNQRQSALWDQIFKLNDHCKFLCMLISYSCHYKMECSEPFLNELSTLLRKDSQDINKLVSEVKEIA